ncbi:putative enzyme related to lactoylglutathione lyase [Paenibacillus castaneae]|uniref:VOC family protein n=1 Tax=Paenibacillus castaneae TaxID=474957 RepID=UPI0011AF15C2|nr:VOC family protein [Paenibacillus castaneae]NIK79700.1 putative enzyme related to lactoylglutathione lyase [Paenibacillus castaneae]
MFALRFETDCIEELYARLSKAGAPIEDREAYGRQFQLFDPDGNMLDIWEEMV